MIPLKSGPDVKKIDANEITGYHALNHKSVANYISDLYISEHRTRGGNAARMQLNQVIREIT